MVRFATPPQRRLVLAAKLRPEDPAANWSLLSRLPDGTDPYRFAEAVQTVLQNNDSFNEVFDLTGAGDIVVTPRAARHHCGVREYRNVEAVQANARELADSAFDLSAMPLYYAEIAVAGDQCFFVFVGAHVLSDGFGFYNLISDFAGQYADPGYLSPSTSSPVDTLEPYTRTLQSAVEHYRQVFDGVDDLQIESWSRRDGRGRIAGSVTRHQLSLDDYREAGELARTLGVRRYAVLLSAYALTVKAIAGVQTVVVSTPMSNRRSGQQSQATRGVRVNALPIRFDITADGTFETLCRRAERQITKLIEYEQYAFSDFSRSLVGSESMDSTQPSASFTVYPRPLAAVVDGVRGEPVNLDRRYLQYPLTLNVEVGDDRVTLIVERADHLPRCDVGKLYTQVIRQAARDEGRALLREMRWADDDAARIDAEQTFPPQTLLDQFAGSVENYADAIAVVDDVGRVTYRELDDMSDAVAAWISSNVADDIVGVHLEPSTYLIATIIGVLKANKAYVPIDTSIAQERFEQIVQGCRGLTILSRSDELSATDGARILRLPTEYPNGQYPSGTGPSVPPSPDALAYVIFTSGTTGTPKGVRITHRSAARFFSGMREAIPIDSGRRWLLFHSISFDISIVESFGAFGSGGTLFIPGRNIKRDPEKLAEFVDRHGVEVVHQTPSAFTMLSRQLQGVRSLVTLILCAERLEFATLSSFVSARPDVTLVNSYGITETTMLHTAYVLPTDPRDFPHESVIGRPFADMAMWVVDDDLRVLPRGVPGQLVMSGPGLMEGYLHRDDLTAECIVTIGGQRSYLSGDRGYVNADGQLVVLGRFDNQVKIRGHRCELGEIEHAVLRAGGVDSVHAMLAGSGLTAELVCFLTLSDPIGTIGDIRQRVRDLLPRYFEPDRFVVLPDLPVNSNGKVDTGVLMQLYASEVSSAPARPTQIVAGDRSRHIDEVVTEIWTEVLGSSDFDGSTRFFDAGGTSGMVLQVGERLRMRLGIADLDVVDLFEHCTPNALTEFLSAKL